MQRFFRPIIEFLIYSNTWVSLAACALAGQFFLITNTPLSPFWMLYIFCLTFIAYNLQRLLKGSWPNDSKHMQWVNNHRKTIYSLLYLALFVAVFFTLQFKGSTIACLFFLGFISLFYTGNWLNKIPNFRRIPYLKIYLIAFSWGVLTTLVPAIETSQINNSATYWLWASHTLFVLGITIPFDIRDLKFDEAHHKTIPQLMGVWRSKILAIILLCISGLFMTLAAPYASIFYWVSLGIPAILIFQANHQKKHLFYSGWLEGSIIPVGLSVWLSVL